MSSRRLVIVLIVTALVVVVLAAIGVGWVVYRGIKSLQQQPWAAPPAVAAKPPDLPDAGQYAVGIHGKDRQGHATTLRGVVLAVHAAPRAGAEAEALAEALALEGQDVLFSLSVVPQPTRLAAMASYLPSVDPLRARNCFTREEGLRVAKQLGSDAVLVVSVEPASEGACGCSLELVDMADEKAAASRRLDPCAAAVAIQQFPSAVGEALGKAGVTLSGADQELLRQPLHPADTYARLGRILCGWPAAPAVEQAREFVREQPASLAALILADLLRATDRPPQEAQAQVERAIAAERERCPAMLYWGARSLASLGQYDRSEQVLAEYEAVKPESLPAAVLRAEIALHRGQVPAAIADARKLVEMNPRNGGAWGMLGQYHFDAGASARSGQYVMNLTPQQQTALYEGMAGAVACLERAAELAPDSLAVWTDLIKARNETSPGEGTTEALDRCDALRPGYPEAYRNMLWVYRPGYLNDQAAYRRVLQRADCQQPEWVWDEIGLADLLREERLPDSARRHYARAASMAPAYFPDGWEHIAVGLSELVLQGEKARQRTEAVLDQAQTCVNRALAQRPGFTGRVARAKLLARRGKYAEAEQALRALVKEQPTAADPLVLLAGTQRARGEWKSAEATFRAAIKAKPRGQVQDEYLGVLQCMALDGRQQEALTKLQSDRRTNAAWFAQLGAWHLGCSYLAIGELDQAERSFRERLRTSRPYGPLDNLALCGAARSDWQGAGKLFAEARKGDGQDQVEPRIGLAVCALKLGRTREALRLYDEAEGMDYRWLSAPGLREQLWPPQVVKAFEELQAARQKAG